jgi:hypothetical protein
MSRLWQGAFKANYRLHVSACGTCSATIVCREITSYCIDAGPTGQHMLEYGQQQTCGDGRRDHSRRISSSHG